MEIVHHATIKVATHYFTVENPTPAMYPVIYRLSANYTQVTWEKNPATGRFRPMPSKTFAIYAHDGRQFRFHKNQYDEFMKELRNAFVPESSYQIEEVPLYEPAKIDLKKNGDWELYEEQVKAQDFVLEPFYTNPDGNRSRLLAMPTGSGKTKTACAIAVKLGVRFAVYVAAKYVDKWVKDLQDNLDLKRSEILAVQGGDILQRTTLYPGSKYEIPKAFVLSETTMNNWFKQYEISPNNPVLEAYECKPYDFFQHLGIGFVIYDEAHEQPHMVYKTFCYLNAPLAVPLTATLLTKDPTLRKIQSMMFPHHLRFTEIKPKKYITTHSCSYQIYDFERSKIQTTEYGRNSYSHNAFERSILRHPKLKKQYLQRIVDILEMGYMKHRVPGDKVRIYIYSTVMADAVIAFLKERYPDFDIRRYMPASGDPYENVLDAEIGVTTAIAAGTAVDIDRLRDSIMTISIDSPNACVQSLGRLREIKFRDHDTDVHFWYMFCSSIPKHVEYHQNKLDLYKERILEHRDELLETIFPSGVHYG